ADFVEWDERHCASSCTMSPVTFKDLPLDIYMVIFGTGIFVFILSLIFCCYFIRSHVTTVHATCVYKALQLIVKIVVLGGNRRKVCALSQTCAVCLEDFRLKEELGVLPCQHASHKLSLIIYESRAFIPTVIPRDGQGRDTLQGTCRHPDLANPHLG
uniref:Ring finger protein 122 n=1 Tax=Scleropages formosus TaxID=113540 RepID=A0A8C9RI96_SCLFO